MVGVQLVPADQAGQVHPAGAEVGVGEEAGVVGAIRDHDRPCVVGMVVAVEGTPMAQTEDEGGCEMHLSLVSLQTE